MKKRMGKRPSAKREGGTGIKPDQFEGKKPGKVDGKRGKMMREKRLSKMEM